MKVVRDRVDDGDPRAWVEPGIYEIADGVWRVPLPIPLDGLTHVNAYILRSLNEVVIVDPGWVGGAEDCLVGALRTLEIQTADVSAMLVTHHHWDHYSAAVSLRRRFGWPLAAGEGEKRSLDAIVASNLFIDRKNVGNFPEQSQRLSDYGAGALSRQVDTMPLQPYELAVEFAMPDRYLEDGELVRFGDRALGIHATPGHTRGHIVLEDSTRKVLMTGDHVLPRITPSFGVELDPQKYPLKSYMSSLEATLALPDRMMLPAHGHVGSSVHVRARELLAHHEERLGLIASVVASGVGSATDIATAMTWTRRQLQLEDLSTFHRMVAVLEVIAHLQVLEIRGNLVATVGASGLRFDSFRSA